MVRRSQIVVIVVAAAGTAVVPVAPLLLRGRLPDPVATHWGLGGRPDGHTALAWLPAQEAGLWLVLCALILAGSRGSWDRRAVRAAAGAALGASAGLVGGTLALTLRANLDRTSWQDAGSIGWGQVALMLGGAACTGALGWVLGGHGPDDAQAHGSKVPEMALGASERPVWIGSARNRWLGWIGGALAGGAALGSLLVVVVPEPWTPGRPLAGPLVPAMIVGLAMLACSSAGVTVDRRGLTVGLGPLRWPARRFALDRIVRAWTDRRSPVQVGGWGYRVRPGGSAVMLRAGECLIVELGSGREFAVSVDDAARGAALLNALKERPA